LDITDTLAPASEQLDAIELASGPRIFQIERVSKGNVEQPVNVHFVDFPRPWRPSKSMRRVLAACWGVNASIWAGRWCELFFDPEVTFGKDKPGGTRISRLSHIDKTTKVPLLISKGRSGMWTVEPLPDSTLAATSPAMTDETLVDLVTTFKAKGIPDEKQIEWASWAIKVHVASLDALTEPQARAVLAELDKRPDVQQEAGE
jgi:hypothetical protein